jgi:hypothetical protein
VKKRERVRNKSLCFLSPAHIKGERGPFFLFCVVFHAPSLWRPTTAKNPKRKGNGALRLHQSVFAKRLRVYLPGKEDIGKTWVIHREMKETKKNRREGKPTFSTSLFAHTVMRCLPFCGKENPETGQRFLGGAWREREVASRFVLFCFFSPHPQWPFPLFLSVVRQNV